ncbi:MAG: acetylornithine/succinylornithine family transaminase [Myxococcota bacterium]
MDLETVQEREARVFLPVVKRLPVALVEGSGSRVRDVEGREYVDLTAGWGVTAIGHCHPSLREAIAEQAGRLMQTTNLFYTLPQLELAERLVEITPAALTRSFFLSSGTEAMEGAIKLAHRATGRTRFVSTHDSFHGRTLGSLSLIGQEKHRAPYEALLAATTRVPYGDLAAARDAIDDATAAVVVEPIQGEGGVNVPPLGYLAGLRERCDETGALLVLDEIQTGLGRTGRWLALEHDGVVPDVLTLGKGLGGGFPIAAFLTSEAVAATVSLGDHGGTYAGNPLGCAAANAVLRVLEEEKLVERAASLGERLRERLEAFAAEHSGRAREVRGRGLLLGLELADAEHAATLPTRALARGVLVNVIAGRVLRFFPALNIPEDDLWPAVDTVLELAVG